MLCKSADKSALINQNEGQGANGLTFSARNSFVLSQSDGISRAKLPGKGVPGKQLLDHAKKAMKNGKDGLA